MEKVCKNLDWEFFLLFKLFYLFYPDNIIILLYYLNIKLIFIYKCNFTIYLNINIDNNKSNSDSINGERKL